MDMGEASWLWLAVIYGDQIQVGRRAAKPASEAKPAGTAGCFTSQTVQSTQSTASVSATAERRTPGRRCHRR